jgi:hypothetical protein
VQERKKGYQHSGSEFSGYSPLLEKSIGALDLPIQAERMGRERLLWLTPDPFRG